MIGSADPQFTSGETDLRGVFVAEGPNGVITVLSRRGTNQYAFYRGNRFLRGTGESGPVGGSGLGGGAATVKVKPGQEPNQALDANIMMQNTSNAFGQVERLKQRLNPTANPQSGDGGRQFR